MNNKIKIAYFIDFLATSSGSGGTERQLFDLINQLDKNKFEPFLFCLQEHAQTNLWTDLKCEKHLLNIYSIFSIKTIIKLLDIVKFLKINKIDIVHTFFFDSIFLGIISSKFAKIKNTISTRRDLGFWYNRKLILILYFINKITKKILVNSQSIKHTVSKIEKIDHKKIDVIHNGIDLAKISEIFPIDLYKKYKINKGSTIIGIVANLNRVVKRVDLLIKAARIVIDKYNNSIFVVIGGGKLKHDLVQLAKNLKVENKIIFCGHQESAIPYIKAFSIGVLTSDSEGFPNSILEYMASGIPVISTNVGGVKELIENRKTGLLFDNNNHEQLASCIIELIENKKLYNNLNENAKNIIKTKYSWEVMINEYEKYYRRLVPSKKESAN